MIETMEVMRRQLKRANSVEEMQEKASCVEYTFFFRAR